MASSTARLPQDDAVPGPAPRRGRPVPTNPRRWLKQYEAAHHLGLSVSEFRASVDVEPRPVTMPKAGEKPVLRYFVEDLDAWVERCSTYRLRRGA